MQSYHENEEEINDNKYLEKYSSTKNRIMSTTCVSLARSCYVTVDVFNPIMLRAKAFSFQMIYFGCEIGCFSRNTSPE